MPDLNLHIHHQVLVTVLLLSTMNVHDIARKNFLSLARKSRDPIPIMTNKKFVGSLPASPTSASVETIQSLFNNLTIEMARDGYGTWVVAEVDGQSVGLSVGIPGFFNIAYRASDFDSEEDAFKYAWNRNNTPAKKRIRLKEVRAIEKKYCAKEKSFAELSKALGGGRGPQLQSKGLDCLSEDIENLRTQLRDDGRWRARLILLWWRLWDLRHH
jgi:hypothetical protein